MALHTAIWTAINAFFPDFMIRPDFPFRPDLLTNKFLEEAILAKISAPPGTKIASSSREPFGEGVGFLSSMLRVKLTWEGPGSQDLPVVLIVKFAPPDLPHRMFFSIFGSVSVTRPRGAKSHCTTNSPHNQLTAQPNSGAPRLTLTITQKC